MSKPLRISGLALGSGAARGFAHVGVIKVLEAQGIHPDVVVGTSAGAVVGALYAAGTAVLNCRSWRSSWMSRRSAIGPLPDRGVLKGESLRQFVNETVAHKPLEALKRPFAVVATDLHSGEGFCSAPAMRMLAVRASQPFPGFQARDDQVMNMSMGAGQLGARISRPTNWGPMW